MKIRVHINIPTPVPSGVVTFGEYNVNHPDPEDPYIVIESIFPLTTELPTELARVAKSVSIVDSFYGGGAKTSRMIGEYSYRTARAVVDREASALHRITLTATDLADASMLYSQIRAGDVYPDVPYEQDQVPAPGTINKLMRMLLVLIGREVTFRALYGSKTA
jgi:hypothetical protein